MFHKSKAIIRKQLTQGLRPVDCAKAVASSLTIGVFPIMGCSTPMNTFSALIFRLNLPVVQAFNWVIGPVKIALIFPFLRIGEWLFQAEPFSLSLTEFSRRFFNDVGGTTQEFAWTFVHAIVGWMLCAPIICLLIYLVAKPILQRACDRISPAQPMSPSEA
ncbi:MAG: DUF2062 domain-containing protein [Verrucomicrobiota bacterium]